MLHLPGWLGKGVAGLADAAGWFGWRPALRTTALNVLSKGVTGDPGTWTRVCGQELRSLEASLADLPSTAQERVYARAMLAFPLALLTLAGFWIASGVIGLTQHDKAVAVISHAMPETMAHVFVRSGSLADILIGAALLFRPITRPACFASILVATGYLLASAVLTPELWADPLGPMVKVLPAMALALVVAALAEER